MRVPGRSAWLGRLSFRAYGDPPVDVCGPYVSGGVEGHDHSGKYRLIGLTTLKIQVLHSLRSGEPPVPGLPDVTLGFSADGATEGSDPVRGQGYPAAPDNPHECQAAGPRGQQAGAVLRHRGDARGR